MRLEYTLTELEALLGYPEIEGCVEGKITGIASLMEAEAGDLSFLGNVKYKGQVSETKASVVLVTENFERQPKAGQCYVRVKNPSQALAEICHYIEKGLFPKPEPGIHPSAVVDETARVAASAYLGPFTYIGPGAEIGESVEVGSHCHIGKDVVVGEGSKLMPRVSILDYCKIGKWVVLYSGVVIGSDGYGLITHSDGTHEMLPQIGIVVVEDNVDIGANTTVDRARFGVTRIGKGTKIDNLVQIGHNVEIGENCLIVAQVGISGSAKIEDFVMMGGKVAIEGHRLIGAKSKIAALSAVNSDLKPGSYVYGIPAKPFKEAYRVEVLKNRLPEFFERLKKLEEVYDFEDAKRQ